MGEFLLFEKNRGLNACVCKNVIVFQKSEKYNLDVIFLVEVEGFEHFENT
jgi:hypothetical protein